MTPVAVVESPLRRSDASRLFRTPRSLTEDDVVNDDEAERRIRRSAASLDDSTATSASTVEDNDNIKMCLQLYSDNKLSKDNAWTVTIIDTFAKLMSRHSSMQNFQVAGSTLEASTKVYGLRVDSVHTDVMRMCSELTRQSARAMDNNREEDEEDDHGANKENDGPAEGTDGATQRPQDSKPKKKRARKNVSTVTKNKETINAPLDTNPFTDPFFAKLNSVVGDVNSSSRLMQNIIPTEKGELRLRMDYSFWDDRESLGLDLEQVEDYASIDLSKVTMCSVSKDHKLHEMLSGYEITDAPAEDEDDDSDKLKGTQDVETRDADNEGLPMNRSALDVHFDIDAEVEPIPVGDAYIIDYATADGADNDDEFNEEDQIALQNCRGLKRKTVIIEDMRPIDSSSANLEYSYRALDNISQFWAGPSHWKFKRSKSLRGLSMRLSTLSGSQMFGKAKPKEKQTRKKKRFELESLDDIISVGEDLFPAYSQSKPVKNITHLKSLICKKWDSKKLKLPTDFHLERNRFDVNIFARGIKVRDFDAAPEPDVPVDDYDYDNPVDQNYCSRVMNDETDTETDQGAGFDGATGTEHHSFGSQNTGGGEGDGGGGAPLNTSLDFIPTEFQGAPDKVVKINIAYAKTAKVVDMKQLKSRCWELITRQINNDNGNTQDTPRSSGSLGNGKARFSDIYRELPHVLSKSMSENISKSLAFYSVLHLTNERLLRLVRQEDLEDFQILPPVTQ
ncbi:condensin complex subunit 2 [Malaya genurostris]|uniref:condensin complex subunit 2 n=1 Tax=Malaya genurostris TaxID=325434 RepID=UPI0026F3EB1C|nr:condensin complex subunit 2 [Malaya genurostris]